MLAVKVPDDPEFSGWLEKELMKMLKVDRHEKLKKVLEDMYQRDSWSLKLMVEDLIVLYKMKKKKTVVREEKAREAYVV
jgi:hypothetical protein